MPTPKVDFLAYAGSSDLSPAAFKAFVEWSNAQHRKIAGKLKGPMFVEAAAASSTRTLKLTDAHLTFLELTGNAAITLSTEAVKGESAFLQIAQDVTGSRMPTWVNAVSGMGGTVQAPNQDASSITMYSCVFNGTNWVLSVMDDTIGSGTLTDGITSLTSLTVTASNDIMAVVDVSDVTDGPDGTAKKLTLSNLFHRGTVTVSDTVIDVTQTWNNAAVTFAGVKLTFTNTASAAASLPFQILGGAAGATNLLSVRIDGFVTTGAGLTIAGAFAGATTINASGVVTLTDVTDASSSTTGAVITAGGVGIAKSLWVGTTFNAGTTITAGTTVNSGTTVNAGTGMTFTTSVVSTTNLATPSAFGATRFQGYANTVNGAVLAGFGTTYDVALSNRAGTVVVGILQNSRNLEIRGPVYSTGVDSQFGITRRDTNASAWALYSDAGSFQVFDNIAGADKIVMLQGGAISFTNAAAAGFNVGPNGASNPAFQVSTNTGSLAAGLNVTGAIAAGTVALAVISSGSNANLSIDAKGSGTITLGGTSTGAITLTRATTMSNALTYGGVTLSNSVTGTGSMVLSASPTFTGTVTVPTVLVSGLTASQAVFTDGSKNLVSNAITGTGNVVMSASPTLTGTAIVASVTLSGTLALTGATVSGAPTWSSTQTLNTSGWAETLHTTRTIWGQNFNGSATVDGTFTQTSGTASFFSTVTGGTYNSQTISSAANFTGTLTVASNITQTAGTAALQAVTATTILGTGTASLGSSQMKIGDVGHGAGWTGLAAGAVFNTTDYALLQGADGLNTFMNVKTGGTLAWRISNVNVYTYTAAAGFNWTGAATFSTNITQSTGTAALQAVTATTITATSTISTGTAQAFQVNDVAGSRTFTLFQGWASNNDRMALATGGAGTSMVVGINGSTIAEFRATGATAQFYGAVTFDTNVTQTAGTAALQAITGTTYVGSSTSTLQGKTLVGTATVPSAGITDANVIGFGSAWTDASTASVKFGARFYLSQTAGTTTAGAMKSFTEVTHTSGTTTNAFGGDLTAEMNGAGGTVTTLYGGEIAAGIRAGTATNMVGLLARTYSISGSPTNATGILISGVTIGSTLNIGLDIAAVSGATTNYAIRTGGGNVLLAGLPTSSAGLATGALWVDTTGGLNYVKSV